MAFCPSCGKQTQESDMFCPNCGATLRQASPSMALQGEVSHTNRLDAEASLARTITLVAMIIQAVFVALIALAALALGILSSIVTTVQTTTVSTATLHGTPITSSNPFNSASFTLSFVATILSIGVVLSVVWIVLDYLLVYKPLQSTTTLQDAKASALILGILQVFFGGLIPGILLIVAYLKIGESINNKRQMTAVPY